MHDTLGDTLLDIVQNSVEAGALIITLDFIEKEGWSRVMIGDNGKGMSEEKQKKALDPFFSDGEKHKRRKIGLGLPFVKQMAEFAEGSFDLQSQEGVGTSVFFEWKTKHPDAPPVEDLPGVFVSMMLFDANYELRIYRETEKGSYSVSREELREVLGELESVASIQLAKQYFESQEKEIR